MQTSIILLLMEIAISLSALILMEVILGIDNIVFLAVVTEKLPESQRKLARNIGLLLALVGRIVLLLAITWVMQLTKPLFSIMDFEVSGRSLILLGGGLFLLIKATHEIYVEVEMRAEEKALKQRAEFAMVIVQILLLDLVFSLDSVITAIGMVEKVWMMIVAIVIAIAIMLIFAGSVAAFVSRHPSVKVLALSFLILIGVLLVAEGMNQHINRGYIYFAMFFSLVVEFLNLRRRTKVVG